jgi:hypothetical protein
MVIITSLDEGTVGEQIEVDLNKDIYVPPEEGDFDISQLCLAEGYDGLRRV